MPPLKAEPKPCAIFVSWLASAKAVTTCCKEYRDTHVDGSALTVKRPDHIRSAHGLALTHLDDCADVAEDVLKEELQVESCLLVDRGRDALDAATAG
jgi:hypothetical protein